LVKDSQLAQSLSIICQDLVAIPLEAPQATVRLW
jgi:hypothetical protein